ncbi:MAG: hypothetical protein ACRD5K_00400 [Candidatus Acidiferrales bacterium]
MAGLLMERLFDSPSFVDVSIALDDPTIYQNLQQVGGAQPDYLMWGEQPHSPYYVVECKGSQTNSSTSIDQLRRGLEQVPSLVFGAGARPVLTMVIATHLGQDATTVFVLDPPGDDPRDPISPGSGEHEKISEKTGERTWKIANVEKFERRTQLSQESELLKWAGLFNQAQQRDRELSRRESQVTLPDFELENRRTDLGTYRGRSSPLFPELGYGNPANAGRLPLFPEEGYRNLTLFMGVEEDLLARTVEKSLEFRDVARGVQERVSRVNLRETSPYQSLGRDGTCMIVEGI